MEGIFILLIGGMVILAFYLIIAALLNGIRIWRQSNAEAGSRRTTLRWLAINLIEPAVNSVLIVGLIFVFGLRLYDWNTVESSRIVLLVQRTWPMLVLILPIFWIGSRDTVCARVNLRLALWGIARWLVTSATLMMPLVLPLGLLVLWLSTRWVKRQAQHTLGPRFQAIGMGAEGVMVAPLEEWGSGSGAGARVMRD